MIFATERYSWGANKRKRESRAYWSNVNVMNVPLSQDYRLSIPISESCNARVVSICQLNIGQSARNAIYLGSILLKRRNDKNGDDKDDSLISKNYKINKKLISSQKRTCEKLSFCGSGPNPPYTAFATNESRWDTKSRSRHFYLRQKSIGKPLSCCIFVTLANVTLGRKCPREFVQQD